MKNFIAACIMLSSASLWAQTYVLAKSEATYTVKLSFKKVEGTSRDLKGKIQCKDNLCEFLIAAYVKTFTSSDSNRDLNMETTVEASKYPVAVAKGTFNLSDWDKAKSTLTAEIEFHGEKKKYDLDVVSKSALHKEVSFKLNLEAHKIVRPSLFTMKIENEVPVHFDLVWTKEG